MYGVFVFFVSWIVSHRSDANWLNTCMKGSNQIQGSGHIAHWFYCRGSIGGSPQRISLGSNSEVSISPTGRNVIIFQPSNSQSMSKLEWPSPPLASEHEVLNSVPWQCIWDLWRKLNVVIEWLTTLLHIREVQGLNLGPETDYPDWDLSLLSSVPPGI
jgi:hypothetical protein